MRQNPVQVDRGDQSRNLSEHQPNEHGYYVLHETSLERVQAPPNAFYRNPMILPTRQEPGQKPRLLRFLVASRVL
ncbi:hypothetical protein AVDCRST_MAG82-1882 [uncultured Rubrobacteraceae bacterium]|uniref:Uncharacterized protein n=1 Tax=uncultured Rubrobacteraceae bacterium TaxID=349277 RepID=A0A6J4PXY8_9ACTN|nr:hypothetical protein AVDCRST_MAG82-1882 [uncultured Rubrobacteraceae bacterium]